MTASNNAEPLKLGAMVNIRNSGYRAGRIVEFCGPLGPGGARIYRVRVRGKPKPAYVEVREDQLEIIPSQGEVSPAAQEKS